MIEKIPIEYERFQGKKLKNSVKIGGINIQPADVIFAEKINEIIDELNKHINNNLNKAHNK